MANEASSRKPRVGAFPTRTKLWVLNPLDVAHGLSRKFGQAQQEPDCCIGGHLLVPYEHRPPHILQI